MRNELMPSPVFLVGELPVAERAWEASVRIRHGRLLKLSLFLCVHAPKFRVFDGNAGNLQRP